MKKFIFSKFAGFQAYSYQLYYQTNSFTGIFRQHFKHTPPGSPPLPPCSSCINLNLLPLNFEEPPMGMFSTHVGKPALHFCHKQLPRLTLHHFILSWIIVVVKRKRLCMWKLSLPKNFFRSVLRHLFIFRFLKTSDGVSFFYKFKARSLLKLLKYTNSLPLEVIFQTDLHVCQYM